MTEAMPKRYVQHLRYEILQKHHIYIFDTEAVLEYGKLTTEADKETFIRSIRETSENAWLTENEDQYAAR